MYVKLADYLANDAVHLAIQDGIQDGHQILPIKAKSLSKAQQLMFLSYNLTCVVNADKHVL